MNKNAYNALALRATTILAALLLVLLPATGFGSFAQVANDIRGGRFRRAIRRGVQHDEKNYPFFGKGGEVHALPAANLRSVRPAEKIPPPGMPKALRCASVGRRSRTPSWPPPSACSAIGVKFGAASGLLAKPAANTITDQMRTATPHVAQAMPHGPKPATG